jgi:hypothetical protein
MTAGCVLYDQAVPRFNAECPRGGEKQRGIGLAVGHIAAAEIGVE